MRLQQKHIHQRSELIIDDAMRAIEKENKRLKDILTEKFCTSRVG